MTGATSYREAPCLLHDNDRTCAKDSWRVTLAATNLLLRARPAPFGPLRQHWG
jgi:hypothetical protein